MATRAATFTSKIRNLKDYHYRITNNLMPQPTGNDIANTLKFFSQTLLSVLKDVPNIPAESYGPRQRDSVRLSVFPNLNYTGLYHAVVNMIELVPDMQVEQLVLGESVLNLLGCLVPFLEHDILDTLPYTVASTLAIFPPTLHKDTIDLLCSNLLPMTLGSDGCVEPTYASESAAAIITLVLQHTDNGCECWMEGVQVDQLLKLYSRTVCPEILSMLITDNGSYHSQILECLMSLKKEILKDILSIIAYGPPAARSPAANLLFYYWPQLNPALADRRGIHYKYSAWPPMLCQREYCVNSGNCQAVKMCLNPALAIQSGDKPPPLYICSDCNEVLRKEQSEYMVDILLPMSHVSTTCENKNCQVENNIAVCTCFSIECASFNGNRPIRFCEICHRARHNSRQGLDHVFHLSIPTIWDCSPEMQRYLLDAIVSLLKEAQPLESKRMVEMGEEHRHRFADDEEMFEVEDNGERKLLSRYGIWLLVELCRPEDDIPIEILGRLLGMMFQWFDATAYLPDDNIGNALERLKSEYIYNWLQVVSKTHFEVIVSCLLPHPVEYARVGGFWDTLATRTTQIKEGLNCFFCLVPYNIITFEIWDYVMPYWLESIRIEVPTEDLHELRVLLSKSFDIDMCPLPFKLDKMYHFVSERFQDNSAYVQEQALQWLQILSTLDIVIPVHTIVSMLRLGVQRLQTLESESGPSGIKSDTPMFSTASPTDQATPPLSPEKCHRDVVESCEIYDRETEVIVPCYIMMLDLCLKQMQLQESPRHLGIFNETSKEMMQLLSLMLKNPWDGNHTCSDEEETVNCVFCQNVALWHQLTAKVMEHFCPRDPIKIPTKEIPKVDDIKHITKPNKEEAKSEKSSLNGVEEKEETPNFDIGSMPIHLQLFSLFLKDLCSITDVDALYSLLSSMKYLILHGECLNYTLSQYPDYIKHSLTSFLIPNLWKFLQAKHSQLAVVGVHLLLHCLTLPTGADIFWKLVETDFTSDDWRSRFAAVEKVTVLASSLETDFIHNNQVIQTALAHAFCLRIGSLEDINASVAQQSIQYLETIKAASIKFQFDTVISDRQMILHQIHLLSNVLPDMGILSWEFFLARFDTLSLEAQLDLESSGDIAYPTDLASSDRGSEHFLRKLNRAKFALARTDSIRSVSQSLGHKPPYRRAVSVPMHLINKTPPPKVENYKDKHCLRQQSAPQFSLGRRRTSKMNLGTFSNVAFPGGQLKEFTDEESNFAALLQKAMDLEGVDRNTVYQLVALLMKFMVNSNQDKVNEEKNSCKAQNVVLRHLNVLLGYNQTEKSFSVPPHKLRSSAVFNAFLTGVPYVLDRNFKLGNMILPITLLLLQYGPSPQRYASDFQPPNYTLWYLEPHTRVSWLTALLVILYKYQIHASPVSAIIQTLVRIVINTVDAQQHKCRKTHDDGFPIPSPTLHRSRDLNKISVSDLENIQETETPPQSPTLPDTATVQMMTTLRGTSVAYSRSTRDRIPEETDSTDEKHDSTPTDMPPKRALKVKRQPRKLIPYLESDPDKMTERHKRDITSKESLTSDRRDSDTPTISATVDSKMVQQIKEFESQRELGKPVSLTEKDQPISSDSDGARSHHRMVTSVYQGHTDVSCSTITTSSSKIDTPKSVSDLNTENVSEFESAEESEKTQTSDADSDRHHGATDSGGDNTQEESKDEDSTPPVQKSNILKPNFRQRKARKTGLTTIELQRMFPELAETAPGQERPAGCRTRKSELLAKSPPAKKQVTYSRYGENVMVERCTECGAILEQYDDDTVGLCIVVLATFIHREPSLATPLLLETLECIARIASSSPYAWQVESNLMVPGNSVSIARQFLRCCLHQLAPNGIFPMLFQGNFDDPQFFKTMASSLVDFPDLTCHAPVQFLLEGLNSKKNLPSDTIMLTLNNLSTYMSCIFLETSAQTWTSIIVQFDIFFRKLPDVLPSPCDMTSIMRIMTAMLKVSAMCNARMILEPFSKLLSFAIQNCSFKLQQVLDICSLCNRAFSKERDKLYLTRTIIFELVQVIKFKSSLPDENFLLLVQFVVLDAGGTICTTNIVGEIGDLFSAHAHMLMSTCAAECMRQHLMECMEFIADLHTLTKIKGNMKGVSNSLNEDTLGSHLKSGIAQYIALEITRSNGREHRSISRYLPWLYHPPSPLQQGPKEFTDCIGHIRLLSWLLIGSLIHTAMTEAAAPITCLPVPLETSFHLAEHILVIMTGFVERSKDSVLHMSSLFHAFILCQARWVPYAEQEMLTLLEHLISPPTFWRLWTMYCESAAAQYSANTEQHQTASSTIMDFWGHVTPGILQLLSHSKVLAEIVNLHFLSLMEALRECNSQVLAKLFPMWTSILFAHHSQLPSHLHVRLQTCQNWEPPSPNKDQISFNSEILLTWLKRIQFKLGQIEIQSSTAMPFYTV